MDSHELAILIPILVPISMFTMIFGIIYLRNRERMAMIERGMDPRLNKPKSSGYNTYTLTWGLLLIGAGIGLFLAYVLDYSVFKTFNTENENPAIYFSLIAIFGGSGLFLSYRIEKNDTKKREEIEG
jgi:tellurite resistance protein TehA-like permease